MKKPELEDFGITSEEYNYFLRSDIEGPISESMLGPIAVGMGVLEGIAVLIAFGTSGRFGWFTWQLWLSAVSAGWVGFYASLFLVMILRGITNAIAQHLHSIRIARSPLSPKIKLYQESEAAYQRAQHEADRARREAAWARYTAERVRRRKFREHWMSLSGPQFERELGALYRQLGYRVEFTPTSGDQGIDLIMEKDGKTAIVQCKSYHHPVGPAVARELYGALISSGADEAILACTAGFTRGVKDFVRGKPITLVSASELARIGESIDEERLQYQA